MKHLARTAVALLALVCFADTTTRAADPPSALPPGEKDAKARLNSSPRHGEFADVTVPGSDKKMKAYVAFTERKEKAPVVIGIQEIFGLSDWIRGVAGQRAAVGFTAIAPDRLSGP